MPDSALNLIPAHEPGDARTQNPQAVIAQFHGRTLTSHFQPIFSIAHRRTIGYEGLMRALRPDGTPESPLELFSQPRTSREMLGLDRLCRSLHAANFTRQNRGPEWLFVNLNSQCLIAEQPDIGFTRNLLERYGLEPGQLVIEILENEVKDPAHLQHFIDHFRELGCLIAIDDFGAGCSNFDRIWWLEPDIVKIDRLFVQRASQEARVARILEGVVALLHETGSLVVLEGIETEAEAATAIAVNADMVQGYYFAYPSPHILADPTPTAHLDRLLRGHKTERQQQLNALQANLSGSQALFRQAVDCFISHRDFQRASTQLFREPRMVRSYLLDEAGYQVQHSIYAPRYWHRPGQRYTPLQDGTHANWSHKPYHYLALEKPDSTQVSQPYLSVADSHMCVTLSRAVKLDGRVQVFCCDLDWRDK